MTNVNSSAVRHALNQTTAAREAIGYFIQRILQQFNNVNHSWNDQQSRRLYAIVLDSDTSLRTSYGELRSLEESLKKTLDTVEKYEQIGRATRTTAAAGVAAAASVASAGTKTAVTGWDWAGLLLISFILPAILCPLINMFIRKLGWVKDGDMTLS